MDAKPPSNPRQASKATNPRVPPAAVPPENLPPENLPPENLPPEILPPEILLADGSAVRPRPWRPAGKDARLQSADALDFTLRTLRAADERRRQP